MKKIPGGHNLFVPDQVETFDHVGISLISWHYIHRRSIKRLRMSTVSSSWCSSRETKWARRPWPTLWSSKIFRTFHFHFVTEISMTGSTRCWQARGHASLLETQCVALIASWCQSFSTSELQVRGFKWKPISALCPPLIWRPEIKNSLQELSSVTSRSRRVWSTCGPTSGRCTSSMPSFSLIQLIRWGPGFVYSPRNLWCFHRISSTSTRISLESKPSNTKSWPLQDTQLLYPQRWLLEIVG